MVTAYLLRYRSRRVWHTVHEQPTIVTSCGLFPISGWKGGRPDAEFDTTSLQHPKLRPGERMCRSIACSDTLAKARS